MNRKIAYTSILTLLFTLTTFGSTALALNIQFAKFINPRIRTDLKIDDSKYYKFKDLIISGVTTPVTSGSTSDVTSNVVSDVPSVVTSDVPSIVVSTGGPSVVTSQVPSIVTSQVSSEVTSQVTSAVTSGVASKVVVPREVASKINTKTLPEMTAKILLEIAKKDVAENPKAYILSDKEKLKFIELYEKNITLDIIQPVKIDVKEIEIINLRFR